MSETCEFCKKPALHKCSGCKLISYCSKNHQKEDWKNHKSICRPFIISESKELGRFLEATRDLNEGDLIISETPLVIGPKIYRDHSIDTIPCIGCYTPIPINEPPGRCTGCGWPSCSMSCPGLTDLKNHGTDCFVLRMRTSFAVNKIDEFYRIDSITPLKCLLLQKRDPKKFKTLIEMESHEDKRAKNLDEFNNVEERIVKYLQDNYLYPLKAYSENTTKVEIIKDCSSKMIHKICGVIETNALEIKVNNAIDLIGLYPTTSMLEHNCLPNTFHVFDLSEGKQFRINVRASKAIKKGEHITTMYTHALWGTYQRLENLYETKFFKCVCERCKDPTELATNLSTLKCLSCGGDQLPKDPLDLNSEWRCNKCPVILNATEVHGLILQIGEDVYNVQRKSPSVKDLNNLLGKISTFLHPNHYHCYAVKHSLVQLYGYQNGYLMNQLSDELLDEKIKTCVELIDINKKIDPGFYRLNIYTGVLLRELYLAKKQYMQRNLIEMRLNDLKEMAKECVFYLQKADEILRHETESSAGYRLRELIKKSFTEFNVWMKHNKIFI